MKKIFLIAAGLAVGAVMFWPAASLEGQVSRGLPNGSVVNLVGSIWNGSGVIRINRGDIPVNWKFNPLELAKFSLTWQVESVSSSRLASAQVSLGGAGTTITNPSFTGDAAGLAAFFPALRLAGMNGHVSLESTDMMRLQIDSPWRLEGQGRLVVQDMVVASISNAPAGTHRIALKGQGDTLAFEVTKSEGPITLEGKGTFNNRNELSFSGSALPLSTLEPEARAKLARWAPLQSDGRYRIEVKTKW